MEAKCKKCRRSGEKLFLKGDRCYSSKCGVVRKPYPPGVHGKRISRGSSEFARQLAMKQKIKRIYGVIEEQFRHHFSEVKHKQGVTGDLLLQRLEMRLDVIVRRSGFAVSPKQARQLVSHKFFLVNGARVDIPSYRLKPGDTISVRESKREKSYLNSVSETLKNKKDFPSWVQVDASKMEAKVLAIPSREDMGWNVDPQMIVEYYSK